MATLHESGRTAEALQAYQEARRLLREQLGIDPGPELQRAHQRILRGQTVPQAPKIAQPRALRRETTPGGTPARSPAESAVPREGPPSLVTLLRVQNTALLEQCARLTAANERLTSRVAELEGRPAHPRNRMGVG
nr:hypothetical protein GCM10020093_116380 [Planobispora longispora]